MAIVSVAPRAGRSDGLAKAVARSLRGAAAPTAGLLVGLGLAGTALDGVLLQQVLGWHPLTADVDAERRATALFFAATLAILLLGLDLLFRLEASMLRPPPRTIVGWMLIGVGLFELLVGLGDHQLTAVRHVRPDAAHVAFWDLAYLAVGLAFALAGMRLLRRPGPLSFRARRGRSREAAD